MACVIIIAMIIMSLRSGGGEVALLVGTGEGSTGVGVDEAAIFVCEVTTGTTLTEVGCIFAEEEEDDDSGLLTWVDEGTIVVGTAPVDVAWTDGVVGATTAPVDVAWTGGCVAVVPVVVPVVPVVVPVVLVVVPVVGWVIDIGIEVDWARLRVENA